MIATIVNVQDLWQTVLAAFVAGVGTTFVFSLALFGVARLSDASRNGSRAESALFGALAALGFVATLLAVVFGVIVMTSK